MLDSKPYDIQFVQRSSCQKGDDFDFVYIYKFFGHNRLKYILRAEQFKNNVFSIKFYADKDKGRDDKYYRLTNNYNAARVIVTCASVIPLLLKDNPTASFCFNASRSRDEIEQMIEPRENNQRYRLYKYAVPVFFGNAAFEHYAFDEVSSYLLVNKNATPNPDDLKDTIKDMFLELYEFYDQI